jgi:hypothetical protein
MKRNLLLKPITLLIAIALTGLTNWALGKEKTEILEINPGPFTSVTFDGAYEIELIQGNEESITVTADKDDIDELKTEIDNGKLRIYTRSTVKLNKFIVVLKFKTLENIEFNGGLKLKSSQKLKFSNLVIKINGGADMELNLSCDKLKIELSGGTNGVIKGNANSMKLILNGAGRIVTDELAAKDIDVQINGAGYASVFASNSIDATIAGVGSIEYSGNPSKVKSNIMGIGSIKEKEK